MDTNLGILSSYVKVQLSEELERVKDLAIVSAREARTVKATMESFKLSAGMNMVQTLATTVRLLETQV